MKTSTESPLLIKVHTEFNSIDFGVIEPVAEVARLQGELNRILADSVANLPEPLAQEAHSILNSYSGRNGDFFSLFYVLIWSFLHWSAASMSIAGKAEILLTTRTAQAMSLFLHLWDDHLCDGQLSIDILRLQLRTLAWQRYTSSSYQLCDLVGVDHQIANEHITQYLTSQHGAAAVADLDEYCRLFAYQVAIWTAIPRLLDYSISGATVEGPLQSVIKLFAICWRLVDDIQDVDLDLMAGKQTAVWIELDQTGRQCWDECQSRSLAVGSLEQNTWQELCRVIKHSGCLARLLSRIEETLLTSSQVAADNGWQGLARELEQSRRGISRALASKSINRRG